MSTRVSEDREVQLYRELVSSNGLNPFMRHNSSARQQMFSAQHLSQLMVMKNPSENYIQTGMEREYGKYTFSIKAPCDMEVIKVVNLYNQTIDGRRISYNPTTYVIYEDVDTKEVGVLEIKEYSLKNISFGFEYVKTEAMNYLRQGEFIPKDTVFAHSPNLTPDGGYKYGKEVNVCYMTHPATSEDGIVVAESLLDDLSYTVYEKRVVEFGAHRFPRNLYGDDSNYKPFPDIGDVIRDDGLLAALCSYRGVNVVTEMSVRSSQKPNLLFDDLVYVEGPGGVVVDIEVLHDEFSRQPRTPHGMDSNVRKYHANKKRAYREIYDTYIRLRRQRKDSLRISSPLHRLLVEIRSTIFENKNRRVDYTYRLNPIDDWRIEFTVKYTRKPSAGAKLTDCHGSKGVICRILPDEHMPVDEDGNRAQIIVDPNSTISRMNIGRLFEHYMKSATRDARKHLRDRLGLSKGQKLTLDELLNVNEDLINELWNYLLRLYEIVSPVRMYEQFALKLTDEQVYEHLLFCINEWIYLYIPPENEVENTEVIKKLQEHVNPTFGPVSYIDDLNRKVTTKQNIRIASMYYLLLDKVGNLWSAVNSVKLQNFGVLSKLSPYDRHSSPVREQPDRSFGESEMRIIQSYSPPGTVPEILDRNGNVNTHRDIVNSILTSENPSDIDNAVDREKIPLGSNRTLTLVNHVLLTLGVQFERGRFNPYKNIFGVDNPVNEDE